MRRREFDYLTSLFLGTVSSDPSLVFAEGKNNKAIAKLEEFTSGEIKKIDGLREKLAGEGIDKPYIDSLFSDKRFEVYRRIGSLFKTSSETKVTSAQTPEDYEARYKNYRDNVLNLDTKIEHAIIFIKEHLKELQNAESVHGVDKNVVVAIMAVETDLGKILGDYNPFNSYVSQLIADVYKNPAAESSRKESAYAQLKELLRYCKRKNISPLELVSSYAGCIGVGQFQPENLNKYFVGKSGKVEEANLNDVIDGIYSIANYLKNKGWKLNGSNEEVDWQRVRLLAGNFLRESKTKNKEKINGTLADISHYNPKNWFAVFKYNNSTAYVRAVLETADAIKAAA